jgi:hypothetical protein
MNGQRPDAAPAPSMARPSDLTAPTIGGGPQVGDFFKGDWFHESPGFQFALNKALDSVNAKSAARGLLRSGDAAKALQSEATGLANQDYANAFARQLQLYGASRGASDTDKNRELNLFQYQQGRGDTNFQNDRAYDTSLWQNQRDYNNQNFNTDRNYQTGRYDTNTGNLFNLTNVGLGAAGNISGAGTNFANAQQNIYGSQANAASDAAYARAQANSQAAGALAGLGQNLFAAWGGGAPSGGGGAQTLGQAWNGALGGGWQTAANPSFVNTPASIRGIF